jgi:hypothetical protein
MKSIFLCTSADSNYFKTKIFNYCLKSYAENTQDIKKYVFLVDTEDFDVNTYDINKKFIDWNLIKAKNINKCIQHGEFVNFLPECNDDDIIIFTDGDIILQREFSDKEFEMIKNIPKNTFLANFNYKLNSTLEDIKNPSDMNSKLLTFLKDNYDIDEDDLKSYKEMNTGVLIGRKKDFHKLSLLYEKTFYKIFEIINHFCSQQYLINVLINKYFNYLPLDYTFHSHAHHSIRNEDESYSYDTVHNSGVPSKLILKNDTYYYNNSVILFAHKLHQYKY